MITLMLWGPARCHPNLRAFPPAAVWLTDLPGTMPGDPHGATQTITWLPEAWLSVHCGECAPLISCCVPPGPHVIKDWLHCESICCLVGQVEVWEESQLSPCEWLLSSGNLAQDSTA